MMRRKPAKSDFPNGASGMICFLTIDCSQRKILDVRQAPAKSGGAGIRYLCRIMHREVPIYFDDLKNRWWYDGKD